MTFQEEFDSIFPNVNLDTLGVLRVEYKLLVGHPVCLNVVRGGVRNKDIQKILFWSDCRYSAGNLYNKLGFTLEDQLAPDYTYVVLADPTKPRESKQSNKKSCIDAREGQTERERTIELGKTRVWDVGKIRWGMNLN